MKTKIFKRILFGILILLIIIFLLMITPRVWSALNPEKPPERIWPFSLPMDGRILI